MIRYKFGGMFRVGKYQARKLYNKGYDVTVTPCRLAPKERGFLLSIELNKNNLNCLGSSFDEIVDTFKWYNCRYDVGLYPAYYIDEDVYMLNCLEK